jgi:hypothetical protein
MPRAVNGTYTLPAGNPVATATVISSVWANTTLADISTVLTASLDRSGNGAMLAGLKLFDGAIGAPGLTWSTETTSGFYRASAGVFRFAIAGVDVWSVGASGMTSGFPAGTALLPSIFFTADPNTGYYNVAADQIGLSLGGTLRVTYSASQIIYTPVIIGPSGNAAAPTYSFSSSNSTGMYLSGAPAIGFSVGNSLRLAIDAIDSTFAGPANATHFRAGNGTQAVPSLSFSNDTALGIYRNAANTGGLVANNTIVALWDNGPRFYIRGQVQGPDGSVGSPGYSFESDTNTGFYRDTADQIAIALGGVTAGQIAQGSFTGTLTGCTTSPTVTVNWSRIGKMVRLWTTSALTATSNTTAMTVTGLPAAITPSTTNEAGLVQVQNNGANAGCRVLASSSNLLDFHIETVVGGFVVPNAAGFTNSGVKGIGSGFCVEYILP